MSSQMSKAAVRDLDQAGFVVHSTRTAKSTVTAELNNLVSPIPRGEGDATPRIDWDVAQETNAELLEFAGGEVRVKDEAYRTEKVRVSEVGRKRRTHMDHILGIHRDMRKSIEGAYGPEALALVGLDVMTTHAIPAVREQMLKMAGRMRTPDLVSRLELRPGHVHLDFEGLAEYIEGQVGVLNDLAEDYKRQRKVAAQAFVVKEEARLFHRRVLVNVTRIQEAYYRLAGLDELARRLRTVERSSSSNGTPEPQPDPSSPTGDEAPGEEAPVTA